MKRNRRWIVMVLCAALLSGMTMQSALASENGMDEEAVIFSSEEDVPESAGISMEEMPGEEIQTVVVPEEMDEQTVQEVQLPAATDGSEETDAFPEEEIEEPGAAEGAADAEETGASEGAADAEERGAAEGETGADETVSFEGKTDADEADAAGLSNIPDGTDMAGMKAGTEAAGAAEAKAEKKIESGKTDTASAKTDAEEAGSTEENEEEAEAEEAEEEEELETAGTVTVEYKTHVQTYGWEEEWSSNGEMSGTEGQAKRLEGIRIRIDGAEDGDYIEYHTHVQTYGWETKWARNGGMSGTEGQAKRLEGIQIRLSPSLEEKYDLYYCVHAQTYGWLGWAKNGQAAGTEGQAKRLEGIRIVLVNKGGAAPEPIGDTTVPFVGSMLRYHTHVQTYGWQDWVTDGQISGTFGQAKRLEGICIQVDPNSMTGLSGSVEYRTHIQTFGWETDWKKDGEMSGTSGLAKRLEAIQIRLTGEFGEKYDIYYRVHAQTYGWLGWAKNGEQAGTEGMSKRLEAIQISIVEKGGPAPGSTFAPMRKATSSYRIPFAQPDAGKYTIRNLLRTALVPCGRTLYQWGGGHGPDSNQAGMPQQWVDFFESHSTETWEPDFSYISYWNGVDCSGYSSWVLANTTGNYGGGSPLAQNVAQIYSGNGWTYLLDKDNTTFRPGDFVSVLYGHIWISLGQCSDGSVLLIHSAGNGIQLSGTGGKALQLANYYMQKYFPYWPYSVINYDWLLEEPSYTARWITNGSGLLTDPDGLQKMSAEQVMKVLLGD